MKELLIKDGTRLGNGEIATDDSCNDAQNQIQGIMKTLPVKKEPSEDSGPIGSVLPGAKVFVSNISLDASKIAWYCIDFCSESDKKAIGWVPANSVTLNVIAKTAMELETVPPETLSAAKTLSKISQLGLLKVDLPATKRLTSIKISAGTELLIEDAKADEKGEALYEITIPSQSITSWVYIPNPPEPKSVGLGTAVFKAVTSLFK
jgi:hypothetical protein